MFNFSKFLALSGVYTPYIIIQGKICNKIEAFITEKEATLIGTDSVLL